MTRLRRMKARVRTVAATLAAAVVAAGAPVGGVPQADALPAPTSPADPAVAATWVNPAIRPGETETPVSLQLSGSPTMDSGPMVAGSDLNVSLTVRNTSDEPVSGLELSARRAQPVGNAADARQALAAHDSQYAWYGLTAVQDEVLAPGESRTVNLTIPTAPGADGTLTIRDAGVYPVMFALRGTDGSVTTERFLLSAVAPGSAGATEGEAAASVPTFSLVYPVTAEVDVTPGETGEAVADPPLLLRSEQLAGQLADGGRLDELLRVYEDATVGAGGSPELFHASCLALDPALVSVVDRMSDGYRVVSDRPELQAPQRLRDSWAQDDEAAASDPGRGAEDAQVWLDRVRAVAAEGCLVSLPWANADLRAVADADDAALMNEAVGRGPAVLQDVLGAAGVTNTIIAPGGYVDRAVVDAAGWADHTSGADAGDRADGAAPEAQNPVRVLVADNTVPVPAPAQAQAGGEEAVEPRFTELAPNVHAVRYQGSLAATLATVGRQPLTVGYSNTATRYDYRVDSGYSRATSAASALRLAVAENTAPPAAETAPEPTLAMLPPTLDPDSARRLLSAAAGVLADDAAEPLALGAYLTPNTPPAAVAEGAGFGAPFPDPSVITDTEIIQASQQAGYLDDLTRLMVNDPAITLTRYGFTQPLRHELLNALTATGRNSLGGYDDAVDRTSRELNANRDTIQELRSSVALLPPGNVYTRASESSPLLLVAENRLPLPVEATIAYDAADPDDTVRLNRPGTVLIPAAGSITVQMTADIPSDQDQTQISLWLATPDGAPISSPVDISVQTRTGTAGLVVLVALLIVVMGLALIVRFGRQRRKKGADSPRAPAPDDSDR